MNLYQIKNEYINALNEVKFIEGVTMDMIADSLVLIKDELEDKVRNIAAYIKNLEANLDAIIEYESQMAQRKAEIRNKIDRLKDYIKHTLEACDIKKVEGDEFDVSLRQNPPSVIINDEAEISDTYKKQKITVTIDKTAIKDAIKAGNEVKGAYLEASTSVMIK